MLKSSGRSAIFTNTGSRQDRQKILSFVKDNLQLPGFDLEIQAGTKRDGSGLYRIYVLRDGQPVYFVELKQGSEGKLSATKFEENLVNAINASSGIDCGESLTRRRQSSLMNWQCRSYQRLMTPLLKGRCFEKLKQRGDLTQLYKEQGVKSREPKTDIISKDGKVRISVKKKGGQFISAQANETRAVFGCNQR